MCDPVSLAAVTLAISQAAPAVTAAVSAASAVAGYAGQKQAAKAQEMAAQDAYIANQQAVNVQQLQVNEQASQQASEAARSAMIQRGRLRALSAEGFAGPSFDRLGGEVDLATSTDLATIERNRSMRVNQGQLEKAGMRANAQSAINTSKRPSEIGLAIDLARAGLGYYDATNRLKIR